MAEQDRGRVNGPGPFFYGWHALMRTIRARLMFSSDARSVSTLSDPRFVRASPSDIVRNSADNSGSSQNRDNSRYDVS